jgi:GTP-binding protein
MFVDEVEIQVEAGKGGDGCVSFRREKYIPRGGPDGGDGGDGGSVILVAQEGVDSLAPLTQRRLWKAQNGQPGTGANCHGRSAGDLLIPVPPGTVVIDAKHGHVLKDLSPAGERVVAALGGKGGKGNLRFKSSTNRAPRQSTPGDPGEARTIRLELKVIADVGLVGKPNAGKSTLLSRLSRARPEIAPYPFTTKHPNLGRVQIDFDRSFVMADIPGLIEGASEGAGLGHEFLRHIQRAGILIHLVEPEPTDGAEPTENYRAIRTELETYDAQLPREKAVGWDKRSAVPPSAEIEDGGTALRLSHPTFLAVRPEIVVVTKADLPTASEVRDRLAESLGREVLLISAVTGQGLNELVGRIAKTLQGEPPPW